MARQYPVELHIGQKVLVHVNPTLHPVEALVKEINHESGTVWVHPIGYQVHWNTDPRAISTKTGLYLHYQDKQFYFHTERHIS